MSTYQYLDVKDVLEETHQLEEKKTQENKNYDSTTQFNRRVVIRYRTPANNIFDKKRNTDTEEDYDLFLKIHTPDRQNWPLRQLHDEDKLSEVAETRQVRAEQRDTRKGGRGRGGGVRDGHTKED